MIVYFSGTGNSKFIAETLGKKLHEPVYSIIELLKASDLASYPIDERLGIVFPVYSWGLPEPIISWIEKEALQYASKSAYVYAIITCGENIGHAEKLLKKKLEISGLVLQSAFSLQMPNNYMLFGDVNAPNEAKEIIGLAKGRLEEIIKRIELKEKGIFDVERGAFPWVMTSLLYPLFHKFGRSSKPFYVEDTCTACGLCERACPAENIHIEGVPKWGNHCYACLACINRCPLKAIQYGKQTKTKGRYFFKDI